MYSCCSTRVFSYLVCAWQQAHVSKQIYVTVNINNVKNTFTKNKKKNIFFSSCICRRGRLSEYGPCCFLSAFSTPGNLCPCVYTLQKVQRFLNTEEIFDIIFGPGWKVWLLWSTLQATRWTTLGPDGTGTAVGFLFTHLDDLITKLNKMFTKVRHQSRCSFWTDACAFSAFRWA